MPTVPTKRYLQRQTEDDLQRKMVFLTGPRQVGKTTLARSIPQAARGYLNWGVPEHRSKILARELPRSPLWVLDEIHKYRSWRNYLKGLWDGREPGQQILVAGSARLDLFRRGGDSLAGRYHLLRLHPFSVAELDLTRSKDLESLLALGGFPEPFLGGSKIQARRWSREYAARLVREDIADLERLHDFAQLELLTQRLPALVGSPLSINALREDLQVAHKTLARWLDVLEHSYLIFRVPVFGGPRLRATKKQQKHYQLDWSIVPDEAARFENLVAAHLLKWVHWLQDTAGRDVELRFYRDREGREVDFVVLENGRPIRLVEVKLSAAPVDSSVRYLKSKFPKAEAWQVHLRGDKQFVTPEGVRVGPVLALLRDLV